MLALSIAPASAQFFFQQQAEQRQPSASEQLKALRSHGPPPPRFALADPRSAVLRVSCGCATPHRADLAVCPSTLDCVAKRSSRRAVTALTRLQPSTAPVRRRSTTNAPRAPTRSSACAARAALRSKARWRAEVEATSCVAVTVQHMHIVTRDADIRSKLGGRARRGGPPSSRRLPSGAPICRCER